MDSRYLEYHYFRRGLNAHPFVDIWLGLWLIGHVLPVATIARKVGRMRDSESGGP